MPEKHLTRESLHTYGQMQNDFFKNQIADNKSTIKQVKSINNHRMSLLPRHEATLKFESMTCKGVL